jgi:hypothetical protein
MTDNTSITTQNDAPQSNSGVNAKTEASPDSSRSSEMVELEELKAEDSPASAACDPEAPNATHPQVISDDVSEGLEPQAAHELSSQQGLAGADLNVGETHDGSAESSSDTSQPDQASGAPSEQPRLNRLQASQTGSARSRHSAAGPHWKKIAAVLLLGAALLGGLISHRHRSPDTRRSGLSSVPTTSMQVDLPQGGPDFSQAQPPYETSATPDATPEAWMQAASQLIDMLLEKRQEIVELQRYYQSGVREIEADIMFENDEKGITTFDQALKDKRIELGLRTIQRRQSYIKQLDQPCQWIEEGSEKLRYLRRKTMVDLDMLPIAAGIDMDANLRHLNAATDEYQPTAEKLAVHVRDTDLQPLKVIWENIRRGDNAAVHREAVDSQNLQIWQEICSGNLEHLAAVTELSTDAAICISRLKVPALFLNNLSRLSPSAARRLFQWKGDWICLNGFENLPPAVAKYLFQWQGRIISLNGLTEFTPELGKLLLTWKGRQIELMGLRGKGEHLEDTGLAYLAQWEKSGGKMFVTDSIREKVETLQ